MTDNFDIKDGNVVKKLALGELFAVEEGPVVEEGSGVTRVKGKSCADEKVGWITIKGNAGTVYATASMKHCAVVKGVPLLKSAMAGSEQELAESEVLHVLANLPKQQPALAEAQKNLTQDIAESRKSGASATSSVTELSKLSPR